MTNDNNSVIDSASILHTQIEAQGHLCDERFARDKERLDKCERKVEEISDCNTKLTCLLEKYDGVLDSHEERLKMLEQKPSLWFDRIITAIISTAISVLVTFLVTQLIG